MENLQYIIDIATKVKDKLNFEFPYNVVDWVKDGMMIENYHKHTTFSNLIQIDCATSLSEMMHACDDRGCKMMFSTEHGYMGEWMWVYDQCKQTFDDGYREKNGYKNPLKFRYSAEVYWVKDRLAEVQVGVDQKTGEPRYAKDRTNCHMVIVARNYNAVRKLNYIISEANDTGFYYAPRIDLDLLFTLDKDDVYITSACVAGWKYEDATELWLRIWKHFGDSFFLEYQASNTEKQNQLNKKIQLMSKQFGIQTIVGLDTHYLTEEDKIKRDNLLLRKGISYPEEEGLYLDFPTGEEVYRRFKEQGILTDEEIIMSMMNTHVFLNGCEDIELDTGFKIPILPEYQDLSYDERSKVLWDLLQSKYDNEDNKSKEREEAIEYEYGEVVGSGVIDYFLTNQKIIELAQTPEYGGVLTTTSRGSAASYYSSKLLGFTTIDRFDAEVPMYPERFITKDRILSSHQMPDIDLNCKSQPPFVEASKTKVGEYGCYPLLAIGKFGEKSGWKMYSAVKGVDPDTSNEISKCIDKYNEALKQADDEDKGSILIEDYIPAEYLKIFNDSKDYQNIIEQAKVHACGHVIFNGNIREKDVIGYGDVRYEIGLIRCTSESTGNSTLVACVEGGLLDSLGYCKLDFLIVDVVGIIDKLYKRIMNRVPSTAELRKMVDGDELTWSMYARGITCCLNQCEKQATTARIMKYKPTCIKELAAFIAGIRPGFKSLIDGFLNRVPYTNGEKAIDDLLEECFKYMLYQEAVMKIFQWLGIPMKDAYDTIKKISKKKLKGEALKRVEDTLKSHWLEKIGNLDNFESVYQVIKDSARYSFNAPHALSMANDSLYEAWAKAHHTSTFYEVTLNHYQEKGDKDKVSALLNEARKFFGYTMGTYEFGKDNSKFTIDDENKIIYPNLASVKGIGEQAVIAIMDIYNKGYTNFVDIYLAIKGTKINASVFKKLIKIGYFKKFGSVKKLLTITKIVDFWKGSTGTGRKTIKKSEMNSLGLNTIDIYKYATDKMASGKISDKQFSNVNWIGVAKALSNNLPDDEFDTMELAIMQYSVLKYCDITDDELDKRCVLVTNLDTTYSPKFIAYSLKEGATCEVKIHNTIPKNKKKEVLNSQKDTPIADGDIIYMNRCKHEERQKKVDNKWIKTGAWDWWINSYSVLKKAEDFE